MGPAQETTRSTVESAAVKNTGSCLFQPRRFVFVSAADPQTRRNSEMPLLARCYVFCV